VGDVYPPSEDTYLLRDAAADEAGPDDTVLEVGTGNATVAEALAGVADRVVATDVNPAAVREARDRGTEAVRADLVSCFRRGVFDLVVFNPPYLPSREGSPDDAMTRALEGGESGREPAERVVDGVGRVLTERGRALVVVSTVSGVREVEERGEERGFEVDKVASDRYLFEEIAVLRLGRRGGLRR